MCPAAEAATRHLAAEAARRATRVRPVYRPEAEPRVYPRTPGAENRRFSKLPGIRHNKFEWAKEKRMRPKLAFRVAAGLIGAAPLGAQSTGLPSFKAPYRAFQRSEFGGVLSFPNPGGTAFEGAYRYASGGSTLYIPVGLSLGRRVDPQGTEVSIVPYAQPTLAFIMGSGRPSDLLFALGVGADFRLSRAFDARVSGGLGDHPFEGVSIGAVWIH